MEVLRSSSKWTAGPEGVGAQADPGLEAGLLDLEAAADAGREWDRAVDRELDLDLDDVCEGMLDDDVRPTTSRPKPSWSAP